MALTSPSSSPWTRSPEGEQLPPERLGAPPPHAQPPCPGPGGRWLGYTSPGPLRVPTHPASLSCSHVRDPLSPSSRQPQRIDKVGAPTYRVAVMCQGLREAPLTFSPARSYKADADYHVTEDIVARSLINSQAVTQLPPHHSFILPGSEPESHRTWGRGLEGDYSHLVC